jgi:hypothetical protein
MRPQLQAFRHHDGRVLYRLTGANGKRLTFDADELSALGSQIQSVLQGTYFDSRR